MYCQDDDRWTKFRQRREEWRARHEARRAAWQERHARRRAEWAEHWGDMSAQMGGAQTGMNSGNWGLGSSQSDEALKTQVATMQATIDKLLNRVAVLEKLAVDGDETRLAAEIEKLRNSEFRT
ncbi:MAG TPA: hypothetical protein VGO52_14610 [Hyphomonadaceae bacterium]|jgi:hypothetical protein|nr:hypothetical protein [Hyphomonadaceae bacterium]